jgi:hypothetical protein
VASGPQLAAVRAATAGRGFNTADAGEEFRLLMAETGEPAVVWRKIRAARPRQVSPGAAAAAFIPAAARTPHGDHGEPRGQLRPAPARIITAAGSQAPDLPGRR